ncbi:MAG: hypothetical protein IJ301_02730 [Clostridia bacterium]|nr:hypothetical protein [Clostridia bacterium]
MRDIEFRAKSIDNDEWLYGFYHNETSKESPASERLTTRHHIYTQNFDKYVDPVTVGQYIGLQDNNDQRIYEGDILYDAFTDDLYVCTFMDGEFVLIQDDNVIIDIEQVHFLSVIGNIHDNPEYVGKESN